MSRQAKLTLLNIALLNAGWFACILGASWGVGWAGPAVVAAIAVANLAVWSRGRAGDMALFLACAMLGLFVDTGLRLSGAITGFASPWSAAPWASPLWMVALWVNFACAAHHSLGWLKGRPWLGAVFGLLGGPAAYWGGEALGAVTMSADRVFALVGVGIVWAAATPLVFALARRLGRNGSR